MSLVCFQNDISKVTYEKKILKINQIKSNHILKQKMGLVVFDTVKRKKETVYSCFCVKNYKIKDNHYYIRKIQKCHSTYKKKS